ncbi:MAG: helix-turn-helix domain-containing protein, partial [Myxococcota bacterium]
MFGPMLREWRTARRYSQSHLAEQAEVSTRHLSCLERGVSAPSRQMVLVLASALDVPLRERNSLLQAAGFASAYRERDLDDLELEPVRQALRFILDQTEPNAAVVVDRLWTIRMMNRPFEAFLSWILERPVSPGMNLARLTVDPSALGRYIVNAAALNDVFIERVRREAQVDNDAELHALVEDLRELAGPPRPFE